MKQKFAVKSLVETSQKGRGRNLATARTILQDELREIRRRLIDLEEEVTRVVAFRPDPERKCA